MSWKYHSATFYGSKQNPQPGDCVSVALRDEVQLDPELGEDSDPADIQLLEFTWTYDGTMSKAQFVAMVKGEVKAQLQALNRQAIAVDASAEFHPA